MKLKKAKKKEKISFTLFEVIVLIAAFSLVSVAITNLFNRKGYNIINKNSIYLNDMVSTYNKIINDYYGEVDQNNLADAAVNGMMDYLNEKYSIYLDKDSTDSLNDKLNGTYRGIGIGINKIKDDVVISKVYEGTPSYEAGIKENDIIMAVNDLNITKDTPLSDLTDLIRKEKKITLSVKRKDEILTFTIEVKNLNVPVIQDKIFEKNEKSVGYIYLSSFTDNADIQFKDALNRLEKQRIDSLIIDLRNNSGGYLTTCTNIASMFLKKGKTIYILDGKKTENIIDETIEEKDYDVVVLVNELSASASEILALALKESYGATIIGKKTFGKGRVQQTSSLSDKTMIKYTTAKWYSPLGNSIDGTGITPGLSVSLSKKYVKNPSDETDDQLQKAIEFLTK